MPMFKGALVCKTCEYKCDQTVTPIKFEATQNHTHTAKTNREEQTEVANQHWCKVPVQSLLKQPNKIALILCGCTDVICQLIQTQCRENNSEKDPPTDNNKDSGVG